MFREMDFMTGGGNSSYKKSKITRGICIIAFSCCSCFSRCLAVLDIRLLTSH
ncbi:MAG: hypothetical protein ABIG39_04050 [Candidatus Micrarchaeota archaeon]